MEDGTTTTITPSSQTSRTTTIQIKTLKGRIKLLEKFPIDSTVRDLYDAIEPLEDTPNGKWKLMIVSPILRTLKPSSDMNKQLSIDYGFQEQEESSSSSSTIVYKVEVVLAMGYCHGSCQR